MVKWGNPCKSRKSESKEDPSSFHELIKEREKVRVAVEAESRVHKTELLQSRPRDKRQGAGDATAGKASRINSMYFFSRIFRISSRAYWLCDHAYLRYTNRATYFFLKNRRSLRFFPKDLTTIWKFKERTGSDGSTQSTSVELDRRVLDGLDSFLYLCHSCKDTALVCFDFINIYAAPDYHALKPMNLPLQFYFLSSLERHSLYNSRYDREFHLLLSRPLYWRFTTKKPLRDPLQCSLYDFLSWNFTPLANPPTNYFIINPLRCQFLTDSPCVSFLNTSPANIYTLLYTELLRARNSSTIVIYRHVIHFYKIQ